MLEIKMEKHGLDYRKFYTKIELKSKNVAQDVARKLSKETGMKWRCFSKSGSRYKFETMIITNRKKRREMMGQTISIEI